MVRKSLIVLGVFLIVIGLLLCYKGYMDLMPETYVVNPLRNETVVLELEFLSQEELQRQKMQATNTIIFGALLAIIGIATSIYGRKK